MHISQLPESLKKLVRPAFYWSYFLKMRIKYLLNFYPIKDAKKIPIIINNINRLSFLKLLIEALEKRGYYNIYIIDNASTYQPLLEYYKTCPYQIFRLQKNLGFLALWKSKIYKQFDKDYFVYTDSDVVPVENCPDDFLNLFWKTLKTNKDVYKVGFSLKIDDLPDHYKQKNDVIEWEKKYFKKPVSPFFFEANIDTTFALYKPGLNQAANIYIKMYRSSAPYEAKHMPWYNNSENLSEEELYYIQHAQGSTHWTKENL